MNNQPHDEAYRRWRASLATLLADASSLAQWQERRYRFAHRVGALLTEAQGGGPAMAGPVLYGVFTSGAGLCYVGQTQEAERRLRDLPVGESHHLANTVPPELWERVVVLRWPLLLPAAPEGERTVAAGAGPGVCGLALEHVLQVQTAPPLNSRRRRTTGDWQPRNLAHSRSRGAVHSRSMPELSQLALTAWADLSGREAPEDSAVVDTGTGRVVFPSALHEPPGT
ncbi:hypothetical protein [Streptomyces nitrosporeus]|uniref:hypothetical protein n=1 Tax=Streptomyces nitrosporeus TaxID=28894 RepID=UPI0039A3792C